MYSQALLPEPAAQVRPPSALTIEPPKMSEDAPPLSEPVAA
jgi:hypothetical protein